MNKQELRAAIRAQKRAMTEDAIREKSAALAKMLFSTELYRNSTVLFGYLPYNQEVRTVPILEQALLDGKKVAVPKVYGDRMRFIYIEELSGIARGSFGIPEPIADGPVAEDETALVLMPGLAFDEKGGRMGYGGGFYDKYLQAHPNHPTAALCYDFQIFPSLPTEAHDIPVDLVLWA